MRSQSEVTIVIAIVVICRLRSTGITASYLLIIVMIFISIVDVVSGRMTTSIFVKLEFCSISASSSTTTLVQALLQAPVQAQCNYSSAYSLASSSATTLMQALLQAPVQAQCKLSATTLVHARSQARGEVAPASIVCEPNQPSESW